MSMFVKRTDELVLQVIRGFGEAGLEGHDIDRRGVAERMMAMYRNKFGHLVDELLQSQFCEENYKSLRLAAHTATNVLERVVRETTLLYDEPATRYLRTEEDERGRRATAGGRIGELLALPDLELVQEDLAGETPTPGDEEPVEPAAGEEPAPEPPRAAGPEKKGPFDLWLEKADLDGLWAEVHRLARFNPAVWVKPEVREREDGKMALAFDVYTPSGAGVIVSPKDRTRAIAWFTWRDEPKRPTTEADDVRAGVTGKGGETRRVWHVWTRTTYYQLDDKAKDVAPPQPNPVGRLPVVTVRLGRPTESYFLDGVGGDLYDGTLELCALRTMQNRAFRDASFKQLVINGDPEKLPADQVMGNPATPIYLGDEATADVMDFGPELAKLSATVQEREQSLATKYGISPDAWRRTAAPTSGYAKKLDQATVLKINKSDRKYIAEAEGDLYRLCALVSRQPGTSGLPGIGQLDPEAPFVVDFAEPRFEEEPLTYARAKAQRIQLGVESVLDWVMEENPDLTEDEAIQLLARNRLVNERFLAKKGMALMELLAMPAAGASSAVANQAKADATPTAGGAGESAPAPTEA